jgi:KUP system potassium uptake protein
VLKYVLIILRTANGSEGGTFTLYSLLCRRFHKWLLPGGGDDLKEQHDGAASVQESRMHALLQQWKGLQWLLLFVLLGTSMVISDGVLTPALSSRTIFLQSDV